MNADMAGNQIAAFYPGPSALTREIDVTGIASTARYGIISAGDPIAMMMHAEQIAATSKLIFDPAQQIVILDGDQLGRGIDLAEVVIGNDYEFGMIERKTGLTIEAISQKVPMTVVTYGDRGSEIRAGGEIISIPTAPPDPLVDPTGAGDAYRAGLVAGLLLEKDLPVAGRMAALAATHALEFHGTQEHTYTGAEFVDRFRAAFPDYQDSLSVEDLNRFAERPASIAR
jgi:adenosine kinase